MTIDAVDRPEAGRHPSRPRRARRRALVPVALAATLAVSPFAAQAAPGDAPQDAADFPAECPWMDASLSADERAQILLDHSSLEQTMRWIVEQPAAAPDRTTWPGDVVYPEQVPCTPDIRFANGAQGLDAPGATAFPVPIAEAAAFDPSLSEAKGAMVADETYRSGRNVLLGPGIAGGRNPLSGRTSEYYGEDPVLSGVLAAANIHGLEDNDGHRVVANLKHYTGNEQELDREMSSSNMDERTLQQIYGLSFEIATREGDPASIMCAYNQVNGTYACENEHLLTDLVRDDWGYDGFMMSDFGAVHSTAPSLDAGLDMELNRPIYYTPERLHAALEAGEITEEQIDLAAFRVVRAFIDIGLFDHPMPENPSTDLITDESRALALEMAEKGSVLLKNDAGTLPLADGPLDVAVVGPTASNTPTDGVSAGSVCSSWLPFGGGRPNVPCPDPVAPLDAITERVEAAGGTVTYADGTDLDEAAEIAAAADVAVVFGYYQMGEFSDITDLRLDGNGDAIIETVSAAAENTVVVTQTGSAVEMPWIDDVDSVLHVWYAGREMGTAVSNLLWGDVNPSGKLPMTFPRSLADTPMQSPEQYPGVFADGSTERTDPDEIRQVEYSEGLQIGYRWYEAQGIEPLFAFGHGLSYTTFEYDKVKVTPRSAKADHEVRVSFRLTNTGDVAGTEVAQVYLTLPDEAGEPFQRLVDFERVHLEPGEHRNVTITLSRDELDTRHLLEYFDAASDEWVTPSGEFEVRVGSSSQATSAPVAFQVH